jgi:putative glutamine amidotransferase
MKRHKPVILITTSNVNASELAPITADTEIMYSDRATAEAVLKAGGLPLYMPSIASLSEEDIAAYLDMANGVLVTGAISNMNPIYYDEAPLRLKTQTRIDDQRDRVDIALVKMAYKKKLPMIGICKGMQVINVALGGTLYQDLITQHSSEINHNVPKTHRDNFTHIAHMSEDSPLQEVFGKGSVHVNGGHQQGVKKLAPMLKTAAVAEDDVVEIFEGKDYPFLVGMQFHPELRLYDKPFLSIFEHFITAAAKK